MRLSVITNLRNFGSLGTQGISIPERIVHNPKLEAHPSNYELRITNYANAPGNPKDPEFFQMDEPNCQTWQATIYVAALDVGNAAVLLQQSDDQRYTLPHFAAEGDMWETTAAKMQEQIEPALHIQGQVLYRAFYQEDKAVCQAEAIMALEIQEPQSLEGEWFTRQMLADATLTTPTYCSLLESILTELETGQVPAKRPPWAKPGWRQEAAELQALLPPLQRLCRKLFDYAIPLAWQNLKLSGIYP